MPEFIDIPNIEFDPANREYRHIEVVDIADLNERRSRLDHDIESPHRVRFNLILFFEEGEGSHFIDFSNRCFGTGTIIFVYRNQIQAFDFSSKPKGRAILFTDDFLGIVTRYISVPVFGSNILHNDYSPVLKLSNSLQQSFNILTSEITKELGGNNDSLEIVLHTFCSLLLMIERERAARFSNANETGRMKQQKVAQFFQLLEHDFMISRNASAYADRMHLSYKTLNQYCKSVTSQTAKQLIDKYVILEAKRRLVLEDKPIQTLSGELGFDEETNFVKYFKKHALITPKKFRQSL